MTTEETEALGRRTDSRPATPRSDASSRLRGKGLHERARTVALRSHKPWIFVTNPKKEAGPRWTGLLSSCPTFLRASRSPPPTPTGRRRSR
jgi:hypothetical protein